MPKRKGRTVSREALIEALKGSPPMPEGAYERMRADIDEVVDGTLRDPYTGDPL